MSELTTGTRTLDDALDSVAGDYWRQDFTDPDAMLDVAEEFKENSRWLLCENTQLAFDCLDETRLICKVGPTLQLPARECALPSLLKRTGFSCEVAAELGRPRLAELLTEFAGVHGGTSILHESFEMLSFAGAGMVYAPMEAYDLLITLYDAIERRLGDYSFENGRISHYGTSMWLSLPSAQKAVADAYADIVRRHKYTCRSEREIMPVVSFSTSDLGDCAAHVTAQLLDLGSKSRINIGDVVDVPHKGKNPLEVFFDRCGTIYARLLKSVQSLDRLFATGIEFPVQCLRNVGKKIGIRKGLESYFEATLALYAAMYGNTPTNAGELYWVLADFVAALRNEGVNDAQVTAVEERINSTLAASFSWKNCDYVKKD